MKKCKKIVCIIIGCAIGVFFVYQFSPIKPWLSNKEIIKQVVKIAKSNSVFPQKVNNTTTYTDITAEPNTIKYHYLVSSLDENNFLQDKLKSFLISNVCTKKESTYLLNKGINIEFSYVVENSSTAYLITLTKEDCR